MFTHQLKWFTTFLTIALIWIPAIAMGTPIIDGVFTSADEWLNSAEDPSIPGVWGAPGAVGWFYQQNDDNKLYIMNDFYVDRDPNPPGELDFNTFEFDLDNNGTYEWVLNVFEDDNDANTPEIIVKKDGTPISPADFSKYGIEMAAGWGVSPKEGSVAHRMYEMSINHAGIDTEIGLDPFDPSGGGFIKNGDRNNPWNNVGPGVQKIQPWAGKVTPTSSGIPVTTPIPEPSTCLLFLYGIVLMAGIKRCR